MCIDQYFVIELSIIGELITAQWNSSNGSGKSEINLFTHGLIAQSGTDGHHHRAQQPIDREPEAKCWFWNLLGQS